jgi:type IV pilus assembly protein PilC
MANKTPPVLAGAFLRGFSEMSQAGVPVADAMRALLDELPSGRRTAKLADVAREVAAGAPLSVALYGAAFSAELVTLIAAAERENTLPDALAMLARDDDLRGQLPLSLLAGKQHPDFPYSLAILASLMIVALVYVMFVLPQMQETFDSVGIPLPAVTLFVFHSLIPYSAGFLACALVAFFLVRKLRRFSSRAAALFDRIWTMIPGARAPARRPLVTRMVELLAGAARCRIPYPLALAYLRTTLKPGQSGSHLLELEQSLASGAPVADSLEQLGGLPGRVAHIADQALQSERAIRVLSDVAVALVTAAIQSDEASRRTLGTVLHITVAALVAASVIAMYLPIFMIGSLT